jgi:hypothetical protein
VVEFDSFIRPGEAKKGKWKDRAVRFYWIFELSVALMQSWENRYGNVDVDRIRESEVVVDHPSVLLDTPHCHLRTRTEEANRVRVPPWASRGLRHVTRWKKDKVMAMLYVEPKPKT